MKKIVFLFLLSTLSIVVSAQSSEVKQHNRTSVIISKVAVNSSKIVHRKFFSQNYFPKIKEEKSVNEIKTPVLISNNVKLKSKKADIYSKLDEISK